MASRTSKPGRQRNERAKALRAARIAAKPLKGREKHKAAVTEVTDRQREVGRLHLARHAQWEIAEKLEISEATVSKDLKVIRAAWRAEAISDVGEATERELKALEASEARLRVAWDEIRALSPSRMKPGLRTLAECKINAELVRIATHRAKLLGLEAPTKFVHQGPDGKPIQHDVTARGPDAATLEEERALRALSPEARRAVLARARAEVESAGGSPPLLVTQATEAIGPRAERDASAGVADGPPTDSAASRPDGDDPPRRSPTPLAGAPRDAEGSGSASTGGAAS